MLGVNSSRITRTFISLLIRLLCDTQVERHLLPGFRLDPTAWSSAAAAMQAWATKVEPAMPAWTAAVTELGVGSEHAVLDGAEVLRGLHEAGLGGALTAANALEASEELQLLLQRLVGPSGEAALIERGAGLLLDILAKLPDQVQHLRSNAVPPTSSLRISDIDGEAVDSTTAGGEPLAATTHAGGSEASGSSMRQSADQPAASPDAEGLRSSRGISETVSGGSSGRGGSRVAEDSQILDTAPSAVNEDAQRRIYYATNMASASSAC